MLFPIWFGTHGRNFPEPELKANLSLPLMRLMPFTLYSLLDCSRIKPICDELHTCLIIRLHHNTLKLVLKCLSNSIHKESDIFKCVAILHQNRTFKSSDSVIVLM